MYEMCLPLLLVDVDGVISLFGFDDDPPAGRYTLVDGHLHYLSTVATGLLTDLASLYELVWCTGWEDRADAHLPAVLGMPAGLAHLSFAVGSVGFPPRQARHWKLDAIDAFAGPDRSLAWIDDAHDDSCVAWAASRPGPTLLVATDPAAGITEQHTRALREWAGQLRGISDP
jgi:hypothetical protein